LRKPPRWPDPLIHGVTVSLRISAAACARGVTTEEGIRSWWRRDADLDSKISGMGQFRFYAGKGVTNVRVDEVMPPVGVGWKRQ
jgi:hypothetical protein